MRNRVNYYLSSVFIVMCLLFCSCSLDDSFFEPDDEDVCYAIAVSPEYKEYALAKQSLEQELYGNDTIASDDSADIEYSMTRRIDMSTFVQQLSEAKQRLVSRFPVFDKLNYDKRQFILYLAASMNEELATGSMKFFTRSVLTDPESVVVDVLRQMLKKYPNQYNIQAYSSFYEDILKKQNVGCGFIFGGQGGDPCIHFSITEAGEMPPAYDGFYPVPDILYFYADPEDNLVYRNYLYDYEIEYINTLKTNNNLQQLKVYLIFGNRTIFEYKK